MLVILVMLNRRHSHRFLLPRRQRGFTLIELMVVLMIMAMLIAIAAPAALEVSQGDKLRDAARQSGADLGGVEVIVRLRRSGARSRR